MSRLALLIVNSVVSEHTEKGMLRSQVNRTANEIQKVLESLPEQYRFEVSQIVDATARRVERAVDEAAKRCAASKDLLLIYYFGHGRRSGDKLSFVHPKQNRKNVVMVPFEGLLHRIEASEPPKVLVILDCCFAGAASASFDTRARGSYCLLACTTASTRARYQFGVENPIGTFTRALIDGFYSPEAAVSAINDSISAKSLFEFAKRATEQATGGLQRPYMSGDLREDLSIYSPEPTIIDGVSKHVPVKSAYAKILLVARVLGHRRFNDLSSLYSRISYKDSRIFLTAYKDEDGRISQRQAHWSVLRKYVGFLRALGAVDEAEIMLSARGLDLISDVEEQYNKKLLALITNYLHRDSLTVDDLISTIKAVLGRRSIPAKSELLINLSLQKGFSLNQRNLGLILDLLGYIGIVGMPKKRDQVYFPWSGRTARQGRQR